MQGIIALLLLSTASLSLTYGQSCLPQGIQFGTPWMLDAFVNDHPGCTHIEGSVTISGSTDPISDLTPLSQITSIGGDLIIQYCLDLETLAGLDNLTSVGGNLVINSNVLTDISALASLTTIGGYLEIRQNDMEDLSGLGSLTSTGGSVVITQSSDLTDLQGLEGLVDIGGGISIDNNSGLLSMNGLAPSSVGAAFWVRNNPQLTDLAAASGLTSIGGALNLQDNASLASLEELSGITELGGYLRVEECPLLTDLSPLSNIDPSTIAQLLFQDLPGVSDCALENICTYLALPDAQPTIANNASGCASVAEVEAACGIVGVEVLANTAGTIRLFPNPVTAQITVEVHGSGLLHYRIMDVLGREVMRGTLANDGGRARMLDVAALRQGTYLLEMNGAKGSAVARFIKE